jgi:hypothetical protein
MVYTTTKTNVLSVRRSMESRLPLSTKSGDW